jgi:hypothetical protein
MTPHSSTTAQEGISLPATIHACASHVPCPLVPAAQVRTRLSKAELQQAELRRALADLQASLAQAAEKVEEAEAEAVGDEWYHLAEHDPRDLTKYGLNGQLVYAEGPLTIIA